MMTARKRRDTLVPLAIAIVAASFALALVATQARADSGSGMNMTSEEMADMATPTPTVSATAVSGTDSHGSGEAMDPNMDMSGGSANWFVVGGVAVLIAVATLTAVLTKRHLRRRMLAGELAGAGTQDV